MGLLNLFGPRLPRAHVLYSVFATEPQDRLVAAFGGDPTQLPAELSAQVMVMQMSGARFRTFVRTGPGCVPAIATQRPDILLATSHLMPADVERLANCRVCYSMEAYGAPAMGLLAMLAHRFTWHLAEMVNGLVQDGIAYLYLPPPQGEWKDSLGKISEGDLEGHVARHITDRRGYWLHTHGLTKFGQPDLQITLPETALTRPADDLVMAVARQLVTTSQTVAGPMALDVPEWGRIALTGGQSRHFDGPVYSLMLADDDPRRRTDTLALLAARVTPQEDTMVRIESGDDAMAAAVAEARRTLPEAMARYPDPRAAASSGVVLAVKVGYPLDAPTEFVWVGVESWDKQVVGRVLNEVRNVTDVVLNQRVVIALEHVTDWCAVRADGSTEGNFTEAVLRGQAGAD